MCDFSASNQVVGGSNPSGRATSFGPPEISCNALSGNANVADQSSGRGTALALLPSKSQRPKHREPSMDIRVRAARERRMQ
jgi:hypothetical protein